MKEPEEDQEASVKMHSTDIPPCKGVEGEIPLVECALRGHLRGEIPVKQPYTCALAEEMSHSVTVSTLSL